MVTNEVGESNMVIHSRLKNKTQRLLSIKLMECLSIVEETLKIELYLGHLSSYVQGAQDHSWLFLANLASKSLCTWFQSMAAELFRPCCAGDHLGHPGLPRPLEMLGGVSKTTLGKIDKGKIK